MTTATDTFSQSGDLTESEQLTSDRLHPESLARGLGWFSLARGTAELLAPETVGHLIGMKRVKRPGLIRLFGLREVVGGLGLLAGSNPKPWLWARVAGDAMDLAMLGFAAGKARAGRVIGS